VRIRLGGVPQDPLPQVPAPPGGGADKCRSSTVLPSSSWSSASTSDSRGAQRPRLMAAAEERFDPQDGNPYDEAAFLDCYPEDGARRWAAAVPRTFCLGSGTVDLHDAASRAFVALCDKAGRPLCIVFPNFDGVYGRHLLASANLPCPAEHFPQGHPRMAEPGRITSVTTGTTEGNDIFDLLSNSAVPCDHEVVQLVRRAVGLVEAKGSAAGSASQIFKQPEADLECRLRAHAFPPKDPDYTAVRDSVQWREHSAVGEMHIERATDSREGGRLHPHSDGLGTDGVVGLCRLMRL